MQAKANAAEQNMCFGINNKQNSACQPITHIKVTKQKKCK
jgi:hypothetical protein